MTICIWDSVVGLPREIADVMDRSILRIHGPFDIAGDGSVAVCRTCRKHPPYPCEHAVKALDRIDRRRFPRD